MESSTLCGIHSKSLKLRYTDGHMGHKWQNELAEVTPERGKATTNTDMEAHLQVGGWGGAFLCGSTFDHGPCSSSDLECPPKSHSHPTSCVEGLVLALGGKGP
jgi:hypothetical protein